MKTEERNPTSRPGWAGVIVTAGIAVIAFAVQWGVVTAKLDAMTRRLDEFLVEARALRTLYQGVETRLAFLEGQHSSTKERKGS